MWNISASDVTLQVSKFSLGLNVEHPEHGLRDLCVDNFPVSCRLLRVEAGIEPHIADCYQRGNDLVVTYHHAQELRPQLQWSAEQIQGHPAVKLVLTLAYQTRVLLSEPRSHVLSDFPASTIHAIDVAHGHTFPVDASASVAEECAGTAMLVRPDEATWSVAQMVHPTDHVASRLGGHRDGYRLDHSLFSGNLERGVILKARVCALLLPREHDDEIACREFRRFVDAPLPLST